MIEDIQIEEIQNENCTDAEVRALLNAFEHTVNKMEPSLACKDRFTLKIERKRVLGKKQWRGKFKSGSKNLTVKGTLRPLPNRDHDIIKT